MAAGSGEVIAEVRAALIPQCAELFAAVFAGPPWHEPWTAESAFQRLAGIAATPGFAGVALVAGGTVTEARVPDVTGHYLISDRGTPAQAFYERRGYAEAESRLVMARPARGLR